MRFEMKLTQNTKESVLQKFITEFQKLCEGKKNFNLALQATKKGIRLHLYTCKGLQEDIYVYVRTKKTLNELVSTINFALMLHANVEISVSNEDGMLFFDIDEEKNSIPHQHSKNNASVYYRVKKFAKSFGLTV